jgi:hypothetical protein
MVHVAYNKIKHEQFSPVDIMKLKQCYQTCRRNFILQEGGTTYEIQIQRLYNISVIYSTMTRI